METRLKNRRLVLVDDDPMLREILGDWLSTHNTIRSFESAEQALSVRSELGETEVFIIDYMLPGMNGAELFRSLRSQFPQAKYIAITGNLNRDAIMEHGNAGWDGLVLKPFDPLMLEENILAIL